MVPKIQEIFVYPESWSVHVARAKIANSITRRTKPGTVIGALPDRLGSFGTANIPHTAASPIGIPRDRTKRIQLSLWFHPQMPVEIRAVSSRRNRMVRLIGCDPIVLHFSCM